MIIHTCVHVVFMRWRAALAYFPLHILHTGPPRSRPLRVIIGSTTIKNFSNPRMYACRKSWNVILAANSGVFLFLFFCLLLTRTCDIVEKNVLRCVALCGMCLPLCIQPFLTFESLPFSLACTKKENEKSPMELTPLLTDHQCTLSHFHSFFMQMFQFSAKVACV